MSIALVLLTLTPASAQFGALKKLKDAVSEVVTPPADDESQADDEPPQYLCQSCVAESEADDESRYLCHSCVAESLQTLFNKFV